MKELDKYQGSVRREAEEFIAKLNSDREKIDGQRKKLHELTVRAADYEVIQQYKRVKETADGELKNVTSEFSPYQKLLQMRGEGSKFCAAQAIDASLHGIQMQLSHVMVQAY